MAEHDLRAVAFPTLNEAQISLWTAPRRQFVAASTCGLRSSGGLGFVPGYDQLIKKFAVCMTTVALPSGERVSAFGQGVIVIPRTSRRERLKENLGALDHKLTATRLAELDRLFPPPTRSQALEML